MADDRGEKIIALFQEASELPVEERAGWLAEACGGDDEMRAEIERLLRSKDEAGDFIETPALAEFAETSAEGTASAEPGVAPERFGPYQVVRKLGRGGMGVVYLAARADGEFDKQVAIKLLPASADEGEHHRFRRERQILADLEHPNIARLLDGGTLNQQPYVVMEFVPGRSLRELLREQYVLPVDNAMSIARQVCAGLTEAHGRGIIHRDVKPENLIVAERHGQLQVKILDFGIAKLRQPRPDTAKTQTAAIIGTVSYMSPEQAMGAGKTEIDARSDIYSLGVVIYEMLTGTPAFQGDSYAAVLYQHQHSRPVPPHKARPDLAIPRSVSNVILKSLSKSPEDRQQTAAQLAEELDLAWHAAEKQAGKIWLKAAAGVAIVLALAVGLWIARSWTMRTAPTAIDPNVKPAEVAAPAESGQLQYRVFKKNDAGKEIIQAPYDTQLKKGDQIHFEFRLPFNAQVYLFFEEERGAIIWANPRPDKPPQYGLVGEWLRVPESVDIPYFTDEEPGKQLFTAVYVPEAVPWALQNVVSGPDLNVKTEDVNLPYARIQKLFAVKLLNTLDEIGQSVVFNRPDANGTYSAEVPEPAGRKVIHHKILLWHSERKISKSR
jgi:hypothetical protein